MPAPNAGFVSISAGPCHSIGLKEDGSIVAWGYQEFGLCDVPEPNEGFVDISSCSYFNLAICSMNYGII